MNFASEVCLKGRLKPPGGKSIAHRMAMAWAIAYLVAEGDCEIEGRDCVSTSYPGFWEDLERLAS